METTSAATENSARHYMKLTISDELYSLLWAVDELRQQMFWVSVQDVADFLDLPLVQVDTLLADAVSLGLCVSANGGKSNRFFNLTQKGVDAL